MANDRIFVQLEDVKADQTAFGDSMRWLAGGLDVGEAFSLHHRTAPAGSASIPHSHSRVTEAFYVLSGRFEFEVATRKFEAGPGTYVQATKGTSHSWRVVGDQPAEALVIFTPSIAREFFREMDAEVRSGQPDRERLHQINVRHGLD